MVYPWITLVLYGTKRDNPRYFSLEKQNTAGHASKMRGLKRFRKFRFPFFGRTSRAHKTQKEYERLAVLFQDVDSNKTKLVDELLKKGYANLQRVCTVLNKVNPSKIDSDPFSNQKGFFVPRRIKKNPEVYSRFLA